MSVLYHTGLLPFLPIRIVQLEQAVESRL